TPGRTSCSPSHSTRWSSSAGGKATGYATRRFPRWWRTCSPARGAAPPRAKSSCAGWRRTRMPGAPDPLYVRARRVLLDALEALADHRRAVVLVGAQAIYLHTGEADLAVAAYTTDADIALDPSRLADEPALEALMRRARFSPAPEPGRIGTWLDPSGIPLDLLVPDAVGGGGRRGARLGAHGDRVARKGRGLEAALVDRVEMTVGALDEADPRRMAVAVAGPAALLVAKLHKIAERQGRPDRLDDKDALDV